MAEFLRKLSNENLYKLAKYTFKGAKPETKKAELIANIVSESKSRGITRMVAELKMDQLKEIVEKYSIDIGSHNASTKTVLRVKLADQMKEDEKFVEKLKTEHLTMLLNAFKENVESKNGNKLNYLVQDLALETGFGIFMEQFDTPYLLKLLKEGNIKGETSSKSKVIAAMIHNKDIEQAKSVKKEVEFSKKKKEIKKGVTYQDIFQHYYLTELVEYCEKNGLPKSGTKKEIKKGVTYQDIFQHYYLTELVEYCEKNGLPKSGTKKELIKKILASFNDEEKSSKKKAEKSNKKAPKRKSTSKRETEEESKEEEEGEGEEQEQEEEQTKPKKSKK
eukprot:TRINITY_DN2201_c0_g1_i3.p1 TRINITY_DN2201_c0_g1~~TRINITY_DN2201_c0_g1_i3.p1  ORF type:complete len:334 (+),score=144.22 TRINITY_DN2201_c0_g1_i3:107-1108(+)